MVSKVKTWFLAPNWDHPPKSVRLGSILSYPAAPFIDKDNALWCPKEGDIDTAINKPEPAGPFKVTVKELKNRKAGIFGRFLESVPLGGEATAETDRSAMEHYYVEEMRTEWFTPSKDLEKKAVESTDVADFLELEAYKEPVYMITGIRIAKGTTITTKKNRGRSLKAWFGLDFTSASVPLKVGAEGGDKVSGSEYVKFRCEGEMVFAYQLREIRQTDGKIEGKPYLTGALLGRDENVKQQEMTTTAEDVGLSDSSGINAEDDLDGSDCACIAPNALT